MRTVPRGRGAISALLLLPPWLLLGGCGGEAPPAAPPPAPTPVVAGAVHQPQLVALTDGELLLVWRRPGAGGSNLQAARSADGGAFGEPVQVNDRPGTVADYDLDELRASIAVGRDGLIAIAWGDTEGDVRLAISRDRGSSFEPSIRLNQSEEGVQSFPSIAFDPSGALHGIWLDTRLSRTNDEEPADLYYARLRDGVIEEANLTADDTPSVCGCCRPGIQVDGDGRVSAAFRNVTADGYRDIFRVEGSLEEGFSPPRRLGPPTWKLDGCPMAGPVVAAEATLWNDASTGDRRTLLSTTFDGVPQVLIASDSGGRILAPPRPVEGATAMFLVPGRPAGRLVVPAAGGRWDVLPATLPAWASSAMRLGDRLLLAGAEAGELHVQAMPFPG